MKRPIIHSALTLSVLTLLWRNLRVIPTSSPRLFSALSHDDGDKLPTTEDVASAPVNTSESTSSQHYYYYPRRFSTNTTLNIARGLNLVNMWSGQSMTTWIYDGMLPVEGNPKSNTWKGREPATKFLQTANDTSKLQQNDTLFVSHSKLKEFASAFLPHVETDIVLISTSFSLLKPSNEQMAPAVQAIVSHPHIVKLFATNTPMRTGGFQDHDKVHSFPLGLKPKMGPAAYRNPIPYYRKAFLEAWNNGNPLNKTKTLYLSPIRDTNVKRKEIVQQPEYAKAQSNRIVGYEEYLQHVAASHFVLSPDGDHPDCHRHYEAIGLAAVPITNLNQSWYEHLQQADTMDGISLYDNDMSNLTTLQAKLEQLSPPQVNRNMIFEEYYMEYIERVVGHRLRWWDVVAGQPAFLDEFAVTANNTAR